VLTFGVAQATLVPQNRAVLNGGFMGEATAMTGHHRTSIRRPVTVRADHLVFVAATPEARREHPISRTSHAVVPTDRGTP
jgi:hypothetical protein